jgi:hypothetical protein
VSKPLLLKHQYEAYAYKAVGSTRLALGRGSVNQIDERDTSEYGTLVTVVTFPFQFAAKFGLQVVSRLSSWSADASNLSGIQRMAIDAETAGTGNCGEHAAVCFVELVGQGVRPVDMASIDDGSHAFVVLGLDLSAIPINLLPTDPANWNKEAIVADAWGNKVGRADVLFPNQKVVSFCRLE